MISDIARQLDERIAELAQALLGKPNGNLSTRSQLRFGAKGSLAVEIDGPKKGIWFDHEGGKGGDGLELIRHTRGLANGAAADWAREWLGHPRSNSPSMSAVAKGPPLIISYQDAHADVCSDKVGAILRDCQDLPGSAGELYLRNRAITAAKLPPSIRFRPHAFGDYGAVVALATDPAGDVRAVQQIYVTEDGCRAPVQVPKRTNKKHDGWSEVAAVRLPGSAPLVLAEGVETALSIWQSTGQETWACLGISNMAKAPVPAAQPVIIAADGDAVGSDADLKLQRTVSALRDRGHAAAVASPPAGMDFNDLLLQEGEDAVRKLIVEAAAPTSVDWRQGLPCMRNNHPLPVLANAIHALRHAPEWQGVLCRDEFANTTIARRPPPWAANNQPVGTDSVWRDRDDLLAAEWLQHHDIAVPASIAAQAVEAVAGDLRLHPVRDYLDGLTWDRVPRIEKWLSTYLGAADNAYSRAIGPRWLISAVARIRQPGAQVDCCLILEGPQGIHKSSSLRVLGGSWFTDRLSDLSSKDAAIEMSGIWIVEIAELDTMSRSEVGTIKAFMTRTVDRFRPPYGRRTVSLPRQCVFAGTVNPEGGYLKDPTGGRRFWPISCGRIDIAALERDRDQLWAEASHRYCAGEPWWPETPELEALAANEQSERYQGDAWEELIRSYLRAGTNSYRSETVDHGIAGQPLADVSVAEVLEQAIGMEKGRWTQADQNRVVRALTSMGFSRYRRRSSGEREWRYRKTSLNSA